MQLSPKEDSDATYYLSTYLAPPGRDSILHSQRHDHAVALWRSQGATIELTSYWELERFTGLKHHDLPLGSIETTTSLLETMLAEEGLTLGDMAEVWGTPGISTSDRIERTFSDVGFPVHSLAHLYSALLVDSDIFNRCDIIALAIDGGPDTALDRVTHENFYVGAYTSNGRAEFRAIESPGPLFIAAQNRFGLAPGTLMALAEASGIATGLDPLVILDGQHFFGGYGIYEDARRILDRIVPAAEAVADQRLQAGEHDGLTRAELVASAAMKVVQELAEQIIQHNIDMLLTESGFDPKESYLALAGGVALNCPANSRFMSHYGFVDLLAPPCVNDSGQALGLGLLGLTALSSTPLNFRLGGAYHGSRQVNLEAGLAEFGERVVSTSEFDLDTFVNDITQAPVAWVAGRAEIGPRALGHRSILADPRSENAKTRLNVMKGRQWWRPVAPIVLLDHADDWFEQPRPSPFMLQTFQVREDRRSQVPAIAHADGSARVQTLEASDNGRLHSALRHFHRLTGVPILCNTSLNDRSEPIASSAADAFNFCLRKDIRIAYVDGVRVELDTAPNGLPDEPHTRRDTYRRVGAAYRSVAWRSWLADGVTQQMVWLLNRYPELRPLAASGSGRTQLSETYAALMQQPALADNYTDFAAEFGPESSGSTRHAF